MMASLRTVLRRLLRPASFLAIASLASWAHGDPLVRRYRPHLPADSAPEYDDLDADGDPDVLRVAASDGTPLQWIDDDDDMRVGDPAGDWDSDCLMIDRNRDGAYGAFGDLMVDWNDEDGDGRADLQTVAENAEPHDTGWGPGHYMIVVDSDGDGVFNCVDWTDYQLKCWEHAGTSRFLEDYLGRSLFLKMHTSTANIRDVRFNWENPFLFYDPDGDGLCEKAIRLCDSPRIHPPPSEEFALPDDGSALTDEMRRIEFTSSIDWVSIAQDLDNDSVPGNEFDFDMTIHFQGEGFEYGDQVHPYRSLRGLPEADHLFYDPRWRRITELVYPDHEAAWHLIFQRGRWTRCWFVFDEDDDCHRWERVELYEPRDPFRIGVREGGLDHHPQSDCSGDRGEWDADNSGGGRLYVGRFDGRIHLYGAEWGCWRIDQDAQYYQGWSRSREQPSAFPTAKYTDTDGNGFLDLLEYDLDGDRVFERQVSLAGLGLDDRCDVIETSTLDYEDFRRIYRDAAEAIWQRALAAAAIAEAHGLDMAPYAFLMTPGSLRDRHHFGYWLAHYVHEELLEAALRRGDREWARRIDRARFGGDWSAAMERPASQPGVSTQERLSP